MKQSIQDEIDKALHGRRRGGRIRVAPAEERTADGIVFDSEREMRRYVELCGLLKCKIIHDLELQPSFPVVIKGIKCCVYKADFRYVDLDGRRVVEDSKGMRTEVYRLKKRLVEASYGIRIIEV